MVKKKKNPKQEKKAGFFFFFFTFMFKTLQCYFFNASALKKTKKKGKILWPCLKQM